MITLEFISKKVFLWTIMLDSFKYIELKPVLVDNTNHRRHKLKYQFKATKYIKTALC